MNLNFKQIFLLSLFTSLLIFSGCDDDEPDLPQLLVGFQSTSIGIGLDDDEIVSIVEFSRAATENGSLEITVTNQVDTEYGSDGDFETDPVAENGVITIPYNAGDDQVQFTIIKRREVAFGESKSFSLVITSVGENGAPGNNAAQSVTFSENPISSGAELLPEVGGPQQANSVFIDLSKQSSVTAERNNWDLGFYSGASFRVILNSSVFMMARPLDKFVMEEVNSEDTLGFAATMNLNCFCADGSWVDDPSGNLANTAIAEISTNDEENPVYILQRGEAPDGTQRGWAKVRILQNGDGYTLQYAEIDATDYDEVSIEKDGQYNFGFVHLENGEVLIEPEKGEWDISFTNHTEHLNVVVLIPYGFRDMVISNREGIETAEILIEGNVTYESFSYADAEALTLDPSINSIGSNWRHTAPPDPADIYNDRFYVVKDGEGNIYKLKFTQLKDPVSGERGFPKFEYELLSN